MRVSLKMLSIARSAKGLCLVRPLSIVEIHIIDGKKYGQHDSSHVRYLATNFFERGSWPKICLYAHPHMDLYRANGRGRFGGQTAEGHPKAFARPTQPLFAVLTVRELETACRFSIL